MRTPAAIFLAAAAMLASAPTPVRAETVTCTPITTLPATITTQGVYCLTKHLYFAATGGQAITIGTNNVTIDCNGWAIDGRAGGAGVQTTGINANGSNNTVVRNCTLQGFGVGIYIAGTGTQVEDNKVLSSRGLGIELYGSNYTVRRNEVRATGGGTAFPNATGIRASGSGDLHDNLIAGVHATSLNANGIYMGIGTGSNIAGNRIHDVDSTAGGGLVNGINLQGAIRSSIRDNVITGAGVGTGITCAGGSGPTVAITGNHIQGWNLAVATCTLNGPDNVAP